MSQDLRLQKILRHLNDCGCLTVQELSRILEVSTPTVYKDVRTLLRQNLVLFKKGWVWLCNEQAVVTPLLYRHAVHPEEKRRIAREAVKLVRGDMTVFLDASSTAAFLVEELAAFPGLTVLTNGLMTAVELRQRGIGSICVGGTLQRNSWATCGPIARQTIGQYHIDIAFFSAGALTARGIIADASEQEVALRRYVLERSAVSVFLCDHSKFDKTSVFSVAPLQEVDYLIADRPLKGGFAPAKGSIIATK